MKFIYLISILTVLFFTGAVIAPQLDANPFWSGVTVVALAALLSFTRKEKQVLYMAMPDLSVVVADLNNYFRQFSGSIWTAAMKEAQFEKYMRPISGVTDRYITTTARRTEFMQAYQSGFQTKGGVQFIPYEGRVYQIKIDTLIDNMPALYTTYLNWLHDEKKTPSQSPFVVWFAETQLKPAMTEEIEKISVKGVHVVPTPGVAGPSINAADGVFTIITNEITAGNLTEASATGVITSANVVDKIEQYHGDLPAHIRAQAGPIFVADDILEWYKIGYRAQYGLMNDYTGPDNSMRLYGTQKYLVGLREHAGSQRILYTPSGAKGNLLKLYDKIELPQAFRFQEFNRDVKVLGEFKRGYSFETLDEVYVNDQE